MAGVGIGPRSITSAPAEVSPASSADSNMYPEIRVSLPTRTLQAPSLRNAIPAAQPSLSMKSGVIGYCPTRPRIPSVPKYFFFIRTPSFLLCSVNGSDHAHHVDRFGDIVHTKNPCAFAHRQCRQGQAAIKALTDRTTKGLPYHALARDADQ